MTKYKESDYENAESLSLYLLDEVLFRYFHGFAVLHADK